MDEGVGVAECSGSCGSGRSLDMGEELTKVGV